MTTHMLEHNQIYVPWRVTREKGVWNITEVTMHRAASGYSLVFSRSANYVFFSSNDVGELHVISLREKRYKEDESKTTPSKHTTLTRLGKNIKQPD
jgi:hypothetical protein